MNKRHYEHTLPNIRGSLSNTYHFSLVAKCGFLGYKDDYMGNGFGFSASSEDLTFGFHYEF